MQIPDADPDNDLLWRLADASAGVRRFAIRCSPSAASSTPRCSARRSSRRRAACRRHVGPERLGQQRRSGSISAKRLRLSEAIDPTAGTRDSGYPRFDDEYRCSAGGDDRAAGTAADEQSIRQRAGGNPRRAGSERSGERSDSAGEPGVRTGDGPPAKDGRARSALAYLATSAEPEIKASVKLSPLGSFCLVLLNSNEFLYVN